MGRITDNRSDVYQDFTVRVVAMLEAGTRRWSKSWAPNIPLRSTGAPYRGISVLTLWWWRRRSVTTRRRRRRRRRQRRASAGGRYRAARWAVWG